MQKSKRLTRAIPVLRRQWPSNNTKVTWWARDVGLYTAYDCVALVYRYIGERVCRCVSVSVCRGFRVIRCLCVRDSSCRCVSLSICVKVSVCLCDGVRVRCWKPFLTRIHLTCIADQWNLFMSHVLRGLSIVLKEKVLSNKSKILGSWPNLSIQNHKKVIYKPSKNSYKQLLTGRNTFRYQIWAYK